MSFGWLFNLPFLLWVSRTKYQLVTNFSHILMFSKLRKIVCFFICHPFFVRFSPPKVWPNVSPQKPFPPRWVTSVCPPPTARCKGVLRYEPWASTLKPAASVSAICTDFLICFSQIFLFGFLKPLSQIAHLIVRISFLWLKKQTLCCFFSFWCNFLALGTGIAWVHDEHGFNRCRNSFK